MALSTGCPDPDVDLPYPPEGQLPFGAVGIRLCKLGGAASTVDDLVLGGELRRNTDRFVALINSLPEPDGQQACVGNDVARYAIWFRYADGTAHAVGYDADPCHLLQVAPDAVYEDSGAFLLALRSQSRAEAVLDATGPGSDDDVTVENNTGEVIWIVLPTGNRASVEDKKSIVIHGPCGYRPLRAERDDGGVVGYLTGACHRETWTLSSARSLNGDDVSTSGIVDGELVANTEHGQRSLSFGGTTFKGPVTRTTSVDDRGHFEMRLPAGRYDVTGGTTVLPGGGSDDDCHTASPVKVAAKARISITVTCGSATGNHRSRQR